LRGSFGQHESDICRGKGKIHDSTLQQFHFGMTRISAAQATRESIKRFGNFKVHIGNNERSTRHSLALQPHSVNTSFFVPFLWIFRYRPFILSNNVEFIS
jgi:hypothetical protein